VTSLRSRRDLLKWLATLAPVMRVAAQEKTFSTDVKVVNVFATVRNKQGQIIRDLGKDDFTLSEDGRPQTIKYFSRESDLPLTLGLLVDTSLSQRRVLGEERQASSKFLDQMMRDKDMAFVIHFDVEVELLQDLTSSRKDLRAALENLTMPERPQLNRRDAPMPRGPRGGGRGGVGTLLYDGVLLASDELMKKQTGRKALILLTDGVDHGSKVPLSEAITAAQRADTLVYSILFADTEFNDRAAGPFGGGRGGRRGGMGRPPARPNRPDGKKVLEQLSKETGGGFFEVSKKQTVDQIYARIQEELRNQYSLGYTSDGSGSGYRKISLTAKKGLLVQAREGYYPQ
jgi:VWFA-related protein